MMTYTKYEIIKELAYALKEQREREAEGKQMPPEDFERMRQKLFDALAG